MTGWEHPVTKDSEGEEILKPKITWSTEEDMLANNNSKALNAIFNGVVPINSSLFRRVK